MQHTFNRVAITNPLWRGGHYEEATAIGAPLRVSRFAMFAAKASPISCAVRAVAAQIVISALAPAPAPGWLSVLLLLWTQGVLVCCWSFVSVSWPRQPSRRQPRKAFFLWWNPSRGCKCRQDANRSLNILRFIGRRAENELLNGTWLCGAKMGGIR